MGTSRSVACDPTLSVDRDLDATKVCDKKTWMERLELVEQGLSKLRGRSLATCAAVADGCRLSVMSFCGIFAASAHLAQAPDVCCEWVSCLQRLFGKSAKQESSLRSGSGRPV